MELTQRDGLVKVIPDNWDEVVIEAAFDWRAGVIAQYSGDLSGVHEYGRLAMRLLYKGEKVSRGELTMLARVLGEYSLDTLTAIQEGSKSNKRSTESPRRRLAYGSLAHDLSEQIQTFLDDDSTKER